MRLGIVSFLWVVPFLSFLAGYQLLRTLSHVEVIEVPQVVGLHMHDAIKTLSSFQLNVRILAEREDADVPEGIIMTQMPVQGTKVKPHQSIFLVITRRPPAPRAPSLYGLVQEEAVAKAREAGIALKMYPIESTYPLDTVIAQSSPPLEEIADKTMAVYISSGPCEQRIFPDLRGKKVSEVEKFFQSFAIKVEFRHAIAIDESNHACTECIIRDQRPLAGTFIDLKRPPLVVLTVSE